MPTGGERLRAAYEAAGVVCHRVEIGELIKAGGGLHCITGFLKRDEITTERAALLSTTNDGEGGVEIIATHMRKAE